MTGGAKPGSAVSVVSAAGSRRGIGTIAEAAAAARAAAAEPGAVTPSEPHTSHDQRQRRDDAAHPHSERGHADDEGAEAIAPRRNRAGAGLLKETVEGADKTAAHLILAGRAYAYGRSIVETKPEAKKPGDTLAIES
ncbi:MAG: hypothetical protein ACM30I_09375 [Gemmatimonas sp.]